MKILVSEIHAFFYEDRENKNRIVKSHCHLQLYHHVKMNVKHECLSLYIPMIEK